MGGLERGGTLTSECTGKLLVCPALGNLRRSLSGWDLHEDGKGTLTGVFREEASLKDH